MNANRPSEVDHKSLQILDELSNNDSLTQRDLSGCLGIALGLVNTYVKNLVTKGYITVKSIPPKRYAYYLTPKGFTEKTRLTYHLLQDYTRIYHEAKNSLKKLFNELRKNGSKRILFAGVDEVAEIAYITLQETDLEARRNRGRRTSRPEVLRQRYTASVGDGAYAVRQHRHYHLSKKRCCCKGSDSSRSIEEIAARDILIR
jgi:DNA-binding MarR family transcriptional regulator